MDAVKFIEERDRMCGSAYHCEDCSAYGKPLGCKVSRKSGYPASEQVEIVEKWSKEHQRKTRQSVFLEQYPDARLDAENILCICPENVYGEKACIKTVRFCVMTAATSFGCRR